MKMVLFRQEGRTNIFLLLKMIGFISSHAALPTFNFSHAFTKINFMVILGNR